MIRIDLTICLQRESAFCTRITNFTTYYESATIYVNGSPVGVSQSPPWPSCGSLLTLCHPMASSNLAFNEKIRNDIPSTNSSSSSNPGTSGSAASFYHADLDKGQRKLSGIHVHMCVCSRCLVFVSSQSCHNQGHCMCTTVSSPREYSCLIHPRFLALSGRVYSWAWASSSQQQGHCA